MRDNKGKLDLIFIKYIVTNIGLANQHHFL